MPKVVKVIRKIAVGNGGKFSSKKVDSYITPSGRYLFVHKSLEIGMGWSVSQKHTGSLLCTGLKSRKIAISMLEALYRRIKKWEIELPFGSKMPMTKKFKRFIKSFDEVENIYSAGRILVVLRSGEELSVMPGCMNCLACGSSQILCSGKFVSDGKGKFCSNGPVKMLKCLVCDSINVKKF